MTGVSVSDSPGRSADSDRMGETALDERNKIARECADLRDQMETMRKEFLAAQERAAVVIAALYLDTGKTVDEVSDRAYDDKDDVLQQVKDRCWEEGFIEGLRAARNATEALILKELE